MAKVFLEQLEWQKPEHGFPKRYGFFCPGCLLFQKVLHPEWDEEKVKSFSLHMINVETVHSFNYDMDNPTFYPSLLWNLPSLGLVCHSYVENGIIRYLADCTHPLKGQEISLPEL